MRFGSLEPNSDWKGFPPSIGAALSVVTLNDDGRASAGGFCFATGRCGFIKFDAIKAPREFKLPG